MVFRPAVLSTTVNVLVAPPPSATVRLAPYVVGGQMNAQVQGVPGHALPVR